VSAGTSIEWTDATWNPIRARRKDNAKIGWHCEKVSAGCANCYSETFNHRRLPNGGTGLPYQQRSRELVETYVDDEVLTLPLRWRKPRKVFVCSMTDLFGEWVTDEQIDRVFAVMAVARWHTFQVLTKRAARMRAYFQAGALERIASTPVGWIPKWMRSQRLEFAECVAGGALANVWLGVSVEDQKAADERIPELLATPAAVRFLSVEPLLGPVRILGHLMDGPGPGYCRRCKVGHGFTRCPNYGGINSTLAPGEWGPSHPGCDRFVRENFSIHWVIVGGESGPGARPMHPKWARSIRAQCAAARVPFFFKQEGAWTERRPRGYCRLSRNRWSHESVALFEDGATYKANEPDSYGTRGMVHLFRHGRTNADPSEWPEDLRVREFPEVRRG
jgi:protein gp37